MTNRAGTRPATSWDALWSHHHAQFRDPQAVISQWTGADAIDPALLRFTVKGDWWSAVAESKQTLIITREYEHLVLAISTAKDAPLVSALRLPHPNGIAVDDVNARLYVASTRNPNMLFEFAPCDALEGQRSGLRSNAALGTLLPSKVRYLPGCLYIHDLALIGGRLHANAVSMNAIIELFPDGSYERVWWPKSIDDDRGQYFQKNFLQLNSIAAGRTLDESFFSASAAVPSRRRPGHLNFPVDGRGVIFSGATREVAAAGLTRPHSARLVDGAVWVDNSGYGEVGRIASGRYEAVAKLPGWTRGLCHCNGTLFVGTSRVIPRFAHYAPGLDCNKSQSGIHAIDLKTGRTRGSLLWPSGNQIFAIERMARSQVAGFPFVTGRAGSRRKSAELLFHGVARPARELVPGNGPPRRTAR